MLQRYKLRLGDGTVLLVDHDGLSTWLVDRKAMVQAGRSGKWIPLKGFLVYLRAAAQREARQQAALREAAPPSTTPSGREDGLPLVPPPPKEDDELPPTPPPSAREDGLPLIPPPPKNAAVSPPPSPADDGPSLASPPPPTAETPGVASPPAGETPSAAPPRSVERDPPHGPADAPETGGEVRITVGEPRLVGDEAPAGATVPGVTDTADPVHIGEPPGVQILADEPAPGPLGPRSVPIDDVPVIPLKPLQDEAPPGPAEPLQDVEPPSVMARPSLQTLADDPAASPAEWTGTPAVRRDDLPIIPLKPPDEQTDALRPPGLRSRLVSPAGDLVPVEAAWTDGPAASVLRALGALGVFLSRCLAPINRLERGGSPLLFEERPAQRFDLSPPSAPTPPPPSVSRSTEIRPLAEEPISPDERRRAPTDDGFPIIPLKPIHDGVSELATRTRRLLVRVRSWLDGSTARLARLLRPERSPVSTSSERSAAAPDPAPPSAASEPREVLQAPPALSELPALRFAPTDEPRSAEDIYEGDDFVDESFVSTIWPWTRRLAWATAVLAVGAFVAMNRDAWLPQATQLSERTLTEIDERVRSGHFATQQQQAVQAAAGELPQLAPETIRLIMSRSPIRVLDAEEVFEIASEAADRGLPALAADEAREVEGLRRALLDELRPTEREQIRELERARARGAAFPEDVRQGLRLYARGARALPPHSLERLQVLLGRAISAGLASQPGPSSQGEG